MLDVTELREPMEIKGPGDRTIDAAVDPDIPMIGTTLQHKASSMYQVSSSND